MILAKPSHQTSSVKLYLLLIVVASTSSFAALKEAIPEDCCNSSLIFYNSSAPIRKESINLTSMESQSRSSSFNPNLENFMGAVRNLNFYV